MKDKKLSDIVKDTCIIICESNEQLVQLCGKLDELISQREAQAFYNIQIDDKFIYISDEQYISFPDIVMCGSTTDKFSFHQININE